MNENLLNRILRDHKRRTRSLALILCLSMLVSLGTFAGFHKTAVAKVYTNEVLDCPYAHEGAEKVAHTHNDDCYDGETLVCSLPEIEAHTHTEECFVEREVPVCGLEENPGHQHTESCYTEREELRCGLDENPGHQHGQNCYNADGVLICTIPEGEGAHTHTPECYETVRELTCTIPEGEGAHTHTAECYETVRELICDKPELPVHVHDAGCFRTEEVTAGEEEKTLPEMPVGDPNADLESASDWERDFDGMELSGNWATDLVLVAATQQGHGESPNNFEAVLNDAGDAWVRHGYTRYGAWYGAPYAEEWSAMFVSFCLRYAGIPAENVPNNPTAAFMAESFSKGELFAGRDYVPAVGDLIFFDTGKAEGIDHMGIVYYVDEENGTINTVEGDRSDAVATFGYHLDDEEIVGYGILPQNPNYIPAEDEDEDEAPDSVIVMTTDEEENEETKDTVEETVPAAPMPAQSWERTAGGIKVVVEAPEGAFPENTKIAVTPVNGNSLKDTVSDAVNGEVLEVQAVDITFFNAEGQVIEPATAIRVSMTPAETEHAEEKANVVHIDLEQQTAEVITQAEGTEEDNTEVVFDAEAFTIYAIVYTVHFEYEVDGETYTSASMPGADYTSLAEVIRGLGIVSEDEVDTFVSKISTVASTNESVAVVETTEDGLCVRVLKDGDAQIVITMQDGAQFRVDVVADGETATGNETATVSTKGDLYLPTEAKLEAKALDDVQGESAIAAVQAAEETVGSTAAAETAYQVFDISLENVEADQYDGFQVEVKLPENVVGRDFRLYHIHDGETKEIKLNTLSRPADDTGLEVVSGFTFETEDFSEFVLKYTVDFTYEGRTWSFPGQGSYRLADVLAVLGIEGSIDDASLTLIMGEDHIGALYLTQVDGEYYINSDIAFADTYELRVRSGEKICIITVTDEQVSMSNNLKDFLTKVTVSGAQLQNGKYVVEEGKQYKISMNFKERANLQFNNEAILTYTLPEGITVPEVISDTIKIAIVSGGRTYEIPATVTANTNGTITVKFEQTDPNYSKLAAATNVGFRVDFDAKFSQNIDHKSWGASIERDIELDTTDHSDVFTKKSGTFDEQTGTYQYTIIVRSDGNTKNVNVKDVISGNALIFNNDVSVTGNSSDYTTNALSSGGKGFDYTFAEMQDGEEITITYSASLDPNNIPKDGKVTADLTKNTVTVQKEGGDPHTAEYSHQIDLKIPNKSNGDLIGTDADGNPIYSWRIEYNSLALAPAAGDVIKDTIAAGSQDYMKYSGNVRVSVYDHQGNEVTGSPRTFTPQSDDSWTYTIPSGDTTPYRYVFEYETVVDKEKVNGTGMDQKLSNTSEGPGGNDGGEITVGSSDKVTITKEVESSNPQEVTWVSHIHVPEGGLSQAVVTDTLPTIWSGNIGMTGNFNLYDIYKEGTLEITGLKQGESYDQVVTADKVVITFYKDSGKTQPGLQGTPGGHDITVKLTTVVNQTWLEYGYDHPNDWQATHENKININGCEDVKAAAVFSKPDLSKRGLIHSVGYYRYELVLSGVTEEPITIEDKFDTALLEVAGIGGWHDFAIFGGNQYDQSADRTPVNYSDTPNGILIAANSIPRQPNGEFYPYYKITYYLKLKDGVNLDELAIENGGQFDLTNTATWGDHESSYTFTTKYEFLNKELLKEATSTDRHVRYQITFNREKSELNGGKDIEMTDTLNKHLSVDYTSIQITTDPEGTYVPYSLSGNNGETIATYIIPDSTAVTITYDAMVVGNGSIQYKNTVVANGETKSVEKIIESHIGGDGSGSTANLSITKVDKYDANKKLAGVKFRLYTEDGTTIKDLKTNEDLQEVILTTNEKGVLKIDGSDYEITVGDTVAQSRKYYLEEIEAPEGYQILSFPYHFTLVSDMGEVDYQSYVYFVVDSFQIKNTPLEGLIVGKTVESDVAADHTKDFTFQVSILTEDGTDVDTTINQKYGDMTFSNGVASFTLKHNQQLSAWNMPEGTKFKVEEKNAEGFTVSTTVGETTSEGAEYTGETSTDYTLVTFKNKKENETGSLKIKKIVTENGNTPQSDAAKSKLAGTYTFTIYTNQACTEAYTVNGVAQTVSIEIGTDGAAVTSEEISGLPAGDYWIKETTPTNGSTPVTNPVKVTVVAGKTGEQAVIAEFTNNIETVDKTATKSWSDNNPDNLTIYFKLFYEVNRVDANGDPDIEHVEVPDAETKELKGGVTSVTWKGLPKYDDQGEEYKYLVKEYVMNNGSLTPVAPDGYVKLENGLTVKNTKSEEYNPKTTYSGTKIWVDTANNGATRPESIRVALKANGVLLENKIAQWTKGTGDKANEWTYTFSDLPVFDENGVYIKYTAVETSADGYDAADPTVTPTSYQVLDNDFGESIERVTECDELDITMAEETDLAYVVIKKSSHTHLIWTQRAITRAEKDKIYEDINQVSGFIGELNDDTVEFVSGLPIHTVFHQGQVTVTKSSDKVMHIEFADHRTWAQLCYGSYKYEYAPGTTSFTNTLKTTEYIVNKTWGDDGQLPPEGAEIQIKLNATVPGTAPVEDPTATPEPVQVNLADIGVSQETIKLNGGQKDGNDTTEAPWEYTWTNLPQYDKNQKLISYSAAETSYTIGETTVALAQYPASSSGDGTEISPLIITNKIPETSIKVLKTWAGGDQGLPDGTSVTLELSATVPGNATGEGQNPAPTEYTLPEGTKTPVLLNGGKEDGDDTEENPWKYEWKELPEYDQNGKKITYAVTETEYTIGTTKYTTGVAADTTPIDGYQFSFTNTVPTEINILKVDNNSQALTGAKFVLKQYEDSNYRQVIKTFDEQEVGSEGANKGKLKFENLTAGYYELVETQAPAGYVISGVNPRFTVEFVEESNKLEVIFTNTPGALVSYNRDTNTFTVINEAGTELPQTGGIGTTLFTALGGLMTVTAGAILTLTSQRRKRNAVKG